MSYNEKTKTKKTAKIKNRIIVINMLKHSLLKEEISSISLKIQDMFTNHNSKTISIFKLYQEIRFKSKLKLYHLNVIVLILPKCFLEILQRIKILNRAL